MDILSLMASPGGFRSNFVSALGIDLEYLAIIFFRTFLVQLVFHCIHSMAEDLGECFRHFPLNPEDDGTGFSIRVLCNIR